MFDAASSARHSRSLQNRASDNVLNHAEHRGGYGVIMVGRQLPIRLMFSSNGSVIQTIATTERNVNWNEGLNRSSGFRTSKTKPAPATVFREFARLDTTGAKAASVNISAALVTEASAPTATAYAHRNRAAIRN